MKNTTFVSAGAGSGKTYRITQDIVRMVKDGYCKSEDIILTTFTDAAASELKEKVRSTLYANGLYESAINIDNAAIGTIHSIAYQLVSRYWYLLGISANVSIMAEEDSQFYISQSLSSLPTEEDLKLFEKVCKSFNITLENTTQFNFEYWKSELKRLIDKTVELCITEEQLEEAKDSSKNLLNDVLGWNSFDITKDVIKNVVTNIKPIYDTIANRATKDKDKKKKELYNRLKDLECYDGTNFLPLSKLHSILSSKEITSPAKYISNEFSENLSILQTIAEEVISSNQVKSLIENYIDTIFRLAVQWKKNYETFKTERCLLDYGDLLLKFDELLNKEEVVEDIKSRYKVAFVDEFQDCSPLQVKSFVRLSELMKKSVWVGDIKQAIYGFRGSNTELIKSIIDEVGKEEDGNKLDSLKYCWRSNKTIVDLVNNIFCEKVFKGQIEDRLIRLGVPERTADNPPAPKERELEHLHVIDGRKENCPGALADKIETLIKNNVYKPNEISVLYRNNKQVLDLVKVLKQRGISFNAKLDKEDVGSDNEVRNISSFINAVVSFAARGDNELSKSIITHYVVEGYTTSKILSDRLRFVSQEQTEDKKYWLEELDIVKRFSQMRNKIANQSVSDAIETIIVELNLSDMIKYIDAKLPTYNYCSALQGRAVAYENMCMNLGLSSTLQGFAEYLKTKPINTPGDDKGVSVMTYHKSKGLEWPCVILNSLGNDPIGNYSFFGVLTLNTPNETKLKFVPSALSSFKNNIIDKFKDNAFFKELEKSIINEAKRLMYVGMTRPKEQLILATYGPGECDKWLKSIGCDSINAQSTAEVINWGGANWNHSVCNFVAPDVTEEISKNDIEFKTLKQQKECLHIEKKYISPSKVNSNSKYKVEKYGDFAERLSISSANRNDATIGDFIHHAMCLWNGDKSVLEELTKKYGITVNIESLLQSINSFWNWMEKKYGTPISIERELPFMFTNEKGQVVNGEIDLVYRTEKGDILVDYKTYQGKVSDLTDANSKFNANKYSGQIELYEHALQLNNRNLVDRLICYMSLGKVIRFTE